MQMGKYNTFSYGSEGSKNVTFVDVLLMYSTFSDGSEGSK